MPTYVYRCENGHTFELFHSISDESPKRCPECDAAARRVPAGGAGFLFKGSGFYITDYRSKGYKESAKKEGSAAAEKSPPSGGATSAPGAAGASGGTTESKPAKPKGDAAPGAAKPGKPTKPGE